MMNGFGTTKYTPEIGGEFLVLCWKPRRFLWWRWRVQCVFWATDDDGDAAVQHELAVRRYGNAMTYRMVRGEEHL
jgi:hypothetical protein